MPTERAAQFESGWDLPTHFQSQTEQVVHSSTNCNQESFRHTNQSADSNWRSHWDIGFSRQSGQHGTKFMYYAAHGNFYLVRYFPPAGSGAYRNWTQYSNSYPYFPYKDKVDCFSTSRSEVPNVGYTQMVVEGDTIPDPLDPGNLLLMGLYNLSAIRTDVHHFKDNKNKDA